MLLMRPFARGGTSSKYSSTSLPLLSLTGTLSLFNLMRILFPRQTSMIYNVQVFLSQSSSVLRSLIPTK